MYDLEIQELSIVDRTCVGKGGRNIVMLKRDGSPGQEPIVRWNSKETVDVFGNQVDYLWKLKNDPDLEMDEIVDKFQNGGELSRSEAALLSGHLNVLIIKSQLSLLNKAFAKLSHREINAIEKG